MSPQRDKTWVRDEVLPSYWTNRLGAFLSTAAHNFKLRKFNATTIEVPAGTNDDLAAIAIDGRWRFREATVQRIMPGGGAGTYDVFVTAKENSISSSPAPYTDNTDYTFDLAIVASGASPTIVPGTVDIHRKVGSLIWDGAAITKISPLVGSRVDDHASSHLPGSTDPIDWATVHGKGTLAARPAAGPTNLGLLYFTTDDQGGKFYRSDGTVWMAQTRGLTEQPVAHAASHIAGASDALAWTTINGRGTLAARPAAAASNAGYSYFATDDTGGMLYRSDGTTWAKQAKGLTEAPVAHAASHAAGASDALDWSGTIHGRGTLAARPAASAANLGYTYSTTDVNGGTLYRSNGASWDQTAKGLTEAPVAHAASHAPGGSDALPWTTAHGSGTLAARPAAAAGNTGYLYLATDDNGGTTYRSSGAAWVQVGASATVPADQFASAAAVRLGLSQTGAIRSGQSYVPTEESRTNAAYGLLPTPDQVQNVAVPANGILSVAFQGMWKCTVAAAPRAAIFIGANQLRVASVGFPGPLTQAAAPDPSIAPNIYTPLASCPLGLVGYDDVGSAYTGDVTTGQVFGVSFAQGGSEAAMEVGGGVRQVEPNVGGRCEIHSLPAGVYTVSVQWMSATGTVTAKERKLFVEARGF